MYCRKLSEKQGGQLSATEAVCVVDALATLQAVMDSDDVESSVEERYAVQQALQIVGPALQQDESTGDRKLNPTECALLQKRH